MNRSQIALLFSISFLFLSLASASRAEALFNPNNIISDEEMLDYTAMSLADIRLFLKEKGGYLANYSCPNAYGETKSAAEIIYDASANNFDCDDADLSANPTMVERQAKCKPVRLNPKFILVLLQKEQSLVEATNPRQSQLDWALGYGCPDNQKCNEYWRGFGKQVNSAILQFYDYMMNPQRYTYKAGQEYTVTNTGRPPSVIKPANRATAGLYNYTPHVYNGNYNFFKLWQKYFAKSYFDGSLLQAKGDPGVWLIQDGKKRAFLSRGALTSRYDINKIIAVNKSDLDKYPTGNPIKFPQYSVVRSPKGNIYLLIDDKRRGFTSGEAFKNTGINPEEIMDASWDDINFYEEIAPITATTTYPTGALLQDKKTGGVYWVENGAKAPIWDKIFLKTKFRFKPIHAIDSEKLASYETAAPVIFDDGEIIKSSASPAVYLIVDGQKRPFADGDIFEAMGYKWTNVITVSEKIINLYETGEPIKSEDVEGDNEDEETSEAAEKAEDASASSTPVDALNSTSTADTSTTSTSSAAATNAS